MSSVDFLAITNCLDFVQQFLEKSFKRLIETANLSGQNQIFHFHRMGHWYNTGPDQWTNLMKL